MTVLVREHSSHSVRQTSIASYCSKDLALGEMQQLVYNCILEAYHRGMEPTDREIAVDLRLSDPNSVRPRRFELMKAGFIVESSKRECTVSHRLALTWKPVFLNEAPK